MSRTLKDPSIGPRILKCILEIIVSSRDTSGVGGLDISLVGIQAGLSGYKRGGRDTSHTQGPSGAPKGPQGFQVFKGLKGFEGAPGGATGSRRRPQTRIFVEMN